MKQFLATDVILIAFSVAQARIGDTLDECKNRYDGPTAQLASDQFAFKQGNVTIIVHVRDGRSIQEDFAPERGAVLSETEMEKFLQENSQGSTWEIIGETPTYMTYFRKDGRATAQMAKANTTTQPGGNVKLTLTGAELIIKYTSAGLRP